MRARLQQRLQECQIVSGKWANNRTQVVWFAWPHLSPPFHQSHCQLPVGLPGATREQSPWQGGSKQEMRGRKTWSSSWFFGKINSCDSLIPSFNQVLCQKCKMPSGRKALNFSRAPSESPHKPIQTWLLSLSPPNMFRSLSDPQRGTQVSFRLGSKFAKSCKRAHVWVMS